MIFRLDMKTVMMIDGGDGVSSTDNDRKMAA
jgi:hypothetical protein